MEKNNDNTDDLNVDVYNTNIFQTSTKRKNMSDEQRKIRKAEQMMHFRSNESVGPNDARLAHQTDRSTKKRAQETVEENAARLAIEADRSKKRRAKETTEQTAARFATEKNRLAKKRANETVGENVARLATESDRSKRRRVNETIEQTAARSATETTRLAKKRANETFGENVARLATEADRSKRRRVNETTEQTAARGATEATRLAKKRANETNEQTATRLAYQENRSAERRLNETPDETSSRLAAQAERTVQLRANETAEQTEVRHATEAGRQVRRRASATQEQAALIRLNNAFEKANRRDKATSSENSSRLAAQRLKQKLKRAEELERQIAELQLQVNFTDESSVEQHSCGLLEFKCRFCQARHFRGEKGSDGKFSSCCHKGKVVLEPGRPFPPFLQDLMSNPSNSNYRNFLDNIRNYNSALSFASMGAKIVSMNGYGPYCFKIHGQTCHQTSNLKPPDNLAPKYAQLYILDSAEATDYRMQLPENEKCLPIIMEKIDAIIRQHNIYAGTYKMMHEIEKEQTALAQIQNMTLPNIGLYLRRDRNLDVRRYNLPNCNEIAMVFVDDNGEPPIERDIRVYARPQTQNPLHNLNILSHHLDPMTYALLFPFGEPGWQPKMLLTGLLPDSSSSSDSWCNCRHQSNLTIKLSRLSTQYEPTIQ